jgi:hypothetical protein
MSSNKKQQPQQQQQKVKDEPEVPLCDFCQQLVLTLKACAGCGCEKYCDATCQKARWPHHKAACKAKREREAKAKEAAKERGSGSGLRDMGAIMAKLMPLQPPPLQPPPQPQRYQDRDIGLASYQDHREELQTMLRQPGLDVNWAQPDTGFTAAHAAAQRGNDKCLSLLISHGADTSKVSEKGWAPIHLACHRGRYACLEVLADAGVDLNLLTADEAGTTPATLCCQNGHVNCLALLGDRGADLGRINNKGLTAAHKASQHGELKCLQLLRKRGADLSKKDREHDYTPLDHARSFMRPECIDYLLSIGAAGRVGDLFLATEADKV